MNENEFDITARAWLDDGPNRMSDRAVLSALEEIHTTRQRRVLWPARRATPARFVGVGAIAAALVISVGLLASIVVPRQPDGSNVGGPSPSSSPAQAVEFPELTTTFVSPLNGFSLNHPDNAAITPAVQIWGWPYSADVDDGFDVFETGLDAVLKGTSTRDGIGGDDPIDKEVDEWLSADNILPGGCGVPRSQQAEITIDGQSGRISECPNRIEATVVAGERLYLFTLEHERSDARAVFDAFVATIDLTPETAVKEPTWTRTFVSPTYGYSFKYGRGGATPARERWDPASGEPYDDAFDFLETGMGAVFYGASTAIQEGVSIDDWTDAALASLVTTRGHPCSPRGPQAPITIDGQPGWISEVGMRGTECSGQIVATVVVERRLYVFMLGHTRDDARAFFDSWIATIDLRPEDAAVPLRTPSS